MPSKHIDDQTWRKVEEITVKAVVTTKTSIKDTEMLRWLVLKGIKEMSEDDFREIAEKKKTG